MKIGVVGMGWVGSRVAMSVVSSGTADELMVCDMKRELAEGEAMDLAHGAAFYPAARVRAVDLEELVTADAVVVAAGRPGTAAESRLDLLRDNTAIVGEIARGLRALRGLLVISVCRADMKLEPSRERSSVRRSGRDREHHRLLLVGRRRDLEAIQHEKDFHHGMADPLVPVHEGVTLDEREPYGPRLGDHGGIELSSVEGRHRLRERSLNPTQVADACGTPGGRKQVRVKRKNLRKREIADHASRR